MPATVLTSQHYNAVRGLISPDVTAEHISDDYLSQQPFAPDAEREVRKRLKAAGIDVEALTGDDRDDVLLAMMHQCASELCLTSAQIWSGRRNLKSLRRCRRSTGKRSERPIS